MFNVFSFLFPSIKIGSHWNPAHDVRVKHCVPFTFFIMKFVFLVKMLLNESTICLT